jgi:hypothetical protein
MTQPIRSATPNAITDDEAKRIVADFAKWPLRGLFICGVDLDGRAFFMQDQHLAPASAAFLLMHAENIIKSQYFSSFTRVDLPVSVGANETRH